MTAAAVAAADFPDGVDAVTEHELCSCCQLPAPPSRAGRPMHHGCARRLIAVVAAEGYLHGYEERNPRRHWWSR